MIARTYSVVCIEDLNVAGMMKNRRLARSVSDASLGEFRRQLEYKTARTGAALRVIDRWYPSSKTCSACGAVKAKLSLSERVYRCDGCGLVMDRDLNAAINIKVAGSAPETINARGGTGRRGNQHGCATQVPVKCEPSRRGGKPRRETWSRRAQARPTSHNQVACNGTARERGDSWPVTPMTGR